MNQNQETYTTQSVAQPRASNSQLEEPQKTQPPTPPIIIVVKSEHLRQVQVVLRLILHILGVVAIILYGPEVIALIAILLRPFG